MSVIQCYYVSCISIKLEGKNKERSSGKDMGVLTDYKQKQERKARYMQSISEKVNNFLI